MTLVEAAPSGEMRVILCLKFDTRAPFDEVAAFKRALIGCDYVLHSVEVSGGFDLMFEAGLPDLAAYQVHLDRFAGPMAALVERHEANFICRRFVRMTEREDSIWVPCRDGRRRVPCTTIDLVEAEGDYVRLHCGEHSWLLHDTMQHMRGKLDQSHFLTLHRSAIVNMAFIESLVHRRQYWVAVLCNGAEQRIAKSHVATVLAQLRTGPTRAVETRVDWRPAAGIANQAIERSARTAAATPAAIAIP